MQLFVIYLKFRFSWAPCVFNCYIWHLYVQFSPYIQRSIEIGKTWLSFRLRKEDALLFSSLLDYCILSCCLYLGLALQTLPFTLAGRANPLYILSEMTEGSPVGTQKNAWVSATREWRGPT